ncbi:ATP-binding protein [Sporomusa sp. GT1]|uniref:sensor histidine kinase n=1 Tax=Sporomusa sp. GT1 TaxID=1534747 RepID=UPI00166D0238|nr:ATP-binding protein [Sporomusa sp. GT1]
MNDDSILESPLLPESIPFSTSARVIYQLGEQLISDEFVALAEVIKNSYDADSQYASIKIDTTVDTPYGKGIIEIIDNGNGMTKSILVQSFMRIATLFKKEQKYSPHFHRRNLGEKGLGRLSIQRLGRHTTLTTSPRMDRLRERLTEEDSAVYLQSNTYKLEIDWSEFESSDEDISKVTGQVSCLNYEIPRFGTTILIQGIKNIDFWNLTKKQLVRIRSEIFGMVNPYIQETIEQFEIKLEVNGKKLSSSEIDENIISLMSDIKVDFSFDHDWTLIINILNRKKLYQRYRDARINLMKNDGYKKYEVKKEYDDKFIPYKINLLDYANLAKNFPYLRDVKFQELNELSQEKRKPAHPGRFSGVLYVCEQSNDSLEEARNKIVSGNLPTRTIKELKAIWSSATGVYIFRNHFRILPYGPKVDWLGFTQRSQRLKANAYKTHTVSGYVKLDSKDSENLREQTNRQGLIEDVFGSNFLMILRDIVAEIIAKEDIKCRSGFEIMENSSKDQLITRNENIVFFKTNVTEQEKTAILVEAKKAASVLIQIPEVNKAASELATTITVLEKVDNELTQQRKQVLSQYQFKLEKLQSIVGLAGQAIIVESLTHELHRIEQNITDHAKESKRILNGLIKKGLSECLDPLKKQELIIQEMLFLERQLEHLEPTYRKSITTIEEISIKTLLEELYLKEGPMTKKAKAFDVRVQVEGEDFNVKGNKGILIIIFDNLFLNSLYWVSDYKNKKITFQLDSENSTITIWDTGPGIHEDILNRIFEPFETMKPDGRGLGMYIVQELMKAFNGSIELNRQEKNEFNRYFKFVLRFPTSNL